MTDIVRATPADAGCWIDGWWGQYGTARLVEVAAAYGYDDALDLDLASCHLAEMGGSGTPGLTDDEHEHLDGGAAYAAAWLNDHVAPEGFSFGWHDGEFFLQSDAWWDEEAE